MTTTPPPSPTQEDLDRANRDRLHHEFTQKGKVAGKHFALSMTAGATNMATVEVTLFKGGACYAERGLVRAQGSDAHISTRIGDDGARGYRFTDGAIKRLLTKEGFFTAEFNNSSDAETAVVEMTPSAYMGLFAINLGDKKDGSLTVPGEIVHESDTYQSIYCPRGSWMMSAPGVRTDFNFFSNMLKLANLRRLLPFFMEKITGNDVVVLGAKTPLKHIDIPAGKNLVIDHREVFGFTEMKYGLDYSPRRKIAGENFESLRFEGPGKLILKHR